MFFINNYAGVSPCGPPGIRPLTADGSRRAAPLYFTPGFLLFSLSSLPPSSSSSSPLPLARCKARAENTAGKKCHRVRSHSRLDRTMYTAKTSPKYRRLRPLDAERVRELSLRGHLAIYPHSPYSFCLSFSQSLSSRYIARSLSLFRSAASARTHPLLNRLPAFPASSPPTVSLIPFSSSSRRFSGFLARARGAYVRTLAGSNPAIKGTAGKSVVRRPRKTAQ